MARNNKFLTDKGLEEPFPSSPVRPPRINLIMRRIDDERLWTWPFYATYAARRALDYLISDRTTRWLDDNTLIINDKLKVTSDSQPSGLSDILEHEYTTQERAWELPHHYYSIGASMFVEREEQWYDRLKPAAPAAKPSTPAPKADKPAAPKAAKPSGLVELPAVIAQITPPLDPKEARGILRKHATKPSHGSWSWPADEVPQIIKLLKEKRK